MTSPTLPDIEDLLKIAVAAGAEIMAIYAREEIAVETKADASPLTEADLAAEALITRELKRLYPQIPVVAEEAAAQGQTPEIGALFFLVDPLDGSKEFIKRNGEFTVNIAVIAKGVPVAGVIHAPALGRAWWGVAGKGSATAAIKDGAIGARTAIAVRAVPTTGLTMVGSRSHASGETDLGGSGLVIDKIETLGSSLKFCLLAEGRADLYPRFGRTMEWDTAAGDAILRAAGGAVVDRAGNPLTYGKCSQSHDADFANGEFWGLGDPGLMATVCPKSA